MTPTKEGHKVWNNEYKEKYGSEYRKQLRKHHIIRSECSTCGKQLLKSDLTHRRCVKCRNIEKDRKYEQKIDRAATGMCHTCNIRSSKAGRMRCEECTQKTNVSQELRRIRLRDAGLCDKCGQESGIPFIKPVLQRGFVTKGSVWKTCRTCYLKKHSSTIFGTNSRYKELVAIFDTQEGRCVYTGEILIFGNNASIDHKKPISRFPELKEDLNNLEWVTDRINIMKRDLTKKEFLAIIRQISENVV